MLLKSGRSIGVGPMRRPGDRKIDTSPYSSGNIAYLSPPSDSNWRRTSSDSAIHQSLMQNQVITLFEQQKIVNIEIAHILSGPLSSNKREGTTNIDILQHIVSHSEIKVLCNILRDTHKKG